MCVTIHIRNKITIGRDNVKFDYIVGNRNFNTYEEAMKYCDLCDFDIHEMIEVKEIKEAEATENKIYWYEFWLRGFSLGCQPKGHIEVNHNKGRWGIIAYDRKLSNEECENYDLKEWIEVG